MMYKILFSSKAIKDLDKLDKNIYFRVSERILELENDPRPVGSLKLTFDDGYRIRTGDYRILYDIDETEKLVKILKIGHRKEVYRRR